MLASYLAFAEVGEATLMGEKDPLEDAPEGGAGQPEGLNGLTSWLNDKSEVGNLNNFLSSLEKEAGSDGESGADDDPFDQIIREKESALKSLPQDMLDALGDYLEEPPEAVDPKANGSARVPDEASLGELLGVGLGKSGEDLTLERKAKIDEKIFSNPHPEDEEDILSSLAEGLDDDDSILKLDELFENEAMPGEEEITFEELEQESQASADIGRKRQEAESYIERELADDLEPEFQSVAKTPAPKTVKVKKVRKKRKVVRMP